MWSEPAAQSGDTVVAEYQTNDRGTVFSSVIKEYTSNAAPAQAVQAAPEDPRRIALAYAVQVVINTGIDAKEPLMVAESIVLVAEKLHTYLSSEWPE